VGSVTVDPSRASVDRGGESVVLRRKTLQVLLVLLERSGGFVSREDLIAEVWDGRAVSDDVLTRCVAELRNAFGDDPKDPKVVKTFPKLGYGLVAPVEIVAPRVVPAPVEPAVTGALSPATQRRWPWMAAVALCVVVAGFFLSRLTRTPPGVVWEEDAWWKLDDGSGTAVRDSSGKGLGGAVAGGAVWVSGKPRGGLRFNGLDSIATGRTGSSLPSGSAPRTISGWIQVAVPLVFAGNIFEYGSDFHGRTVKHFGLGIGPDGRMRFGSSAAGAEMEGTGRWDDGSWHLVTATYEGPPAHTARIFVDGQLDKAQNLTATPDTDTRFPWRIGQAGFGGAAFRGTIADVRVYGRALDEAQVNALYRCSADLKDAGVYYYLPVAQPPGHYGLVLEQRGPGDLSTPFRNGLNDYAGIQLARSDGSCGIAGLRGADVGQDLRISVDVLAPAAGPDRNTVAGPYFRSRKAGAGDGLIGGKSAGYWVQLHSTGMVKVKLLNPQAVIAFSVPPAGFDPAIFHHLDVEARGEILQVWLDGQAVSFDSGGRQLERVPIPPAWNGPAIRGENQGAAGVAFGAEEYRLIGGERARNLQVTPLPPPQ